MYMSAIGLNRASDETKVRNEIVWSAILEDRCAHGRDNDTAVNIYFKRLRAMSDGFLAGVKRDYHGTFLPPPPSPPKPPQQPPPPAEAPATPSATAASSADALTIPLSTALSILNTDSSMFSSVSDSGVQDTTITLHDHQVCMPNKLS